MNVDRIKDASDEPVRQTVVGRFSPATRLMHTYIPTLRQVGYPEITEVHEGLHRDMAMDSELGCFEEALWMLLTSVHAPPLEREKASNILARIKEYAWMAHESYTVYGSVMQAFGNSPDEFFAHMAHQDERYKAACRRYSETLGPPTKGMKQIRISTLYYLAGCISKAALNVPILARFKSYAEVSEKKVVDFFGDEWHNPDTRQDKILAQLADSKTLNHLLEKCESFLKEQIAKHSWGKRALDDWKELTVIACQLEEEIIMKELQVLLPQIVWPPVDQRVKQYQEVFDSWRSEWVSRGYKNAERLKLTIYAGTDEAIRKGVDDYLQADKIEISPQNLPFYQFRLFNLPLRSVEQHIESVRVTHDGLLVCIVWEAQSVRFETCPWQWQTDGRIKICVGSSSNVLAGPCCFSCSIQQAQGIIDTLASVNVIWVRRLDLEDSMIDSGKKLPIFPGLNFICALSCATNQIIEKCKRLAGEGAFSIFWVRNSILFLIATLPDKVTFYIFPTIYERAIITKEALEDANNITFLEEPDKVETEGAIKDYPPLQMPSTKLDIFIENRDVLADIISLVYGEEVQSIVEIPKMRYPLIEEIAK